MDLSMEGRYPVWTVLLFGLFQLTTNFGDFESIVPKLKWNLGKMRSEI
jgi:hypothetical protein